MERAEVKKILSEQLQLLAEFSKNSVDYKELCRLTEAMIALVHEMAQKENFTPVELIEKAVVQATDGTAEVSQDSSSQSSGT